MRAVEPQPCEKAVAPFRRLFALSQLCRLHGLASHPAEHERRHEIEFFALLVLDDLELAGISYGTCVIALIKVRHEGEAVDRLPVSALPSCEYESPTLRGVIGALD